MKPITNLDEFRAKCKKVAQVCFGEPENVSIGRELERLLADAQALGQIMTPKEAMAASIEISAVMYGAAKAARREAK